MRVPKLPALVIGLVLVGRAAGAVEAVSDEGSGFFGRWVARHLSVGFHVAEFRLEDTRRSTDHGFDNTNVTGNFLGSLWGLDAEQHYFPNPFLEYRVVSSFGLGVAYDQARAKTLDWGNVAHTIAAGDGDLEIRGLQFYAFGRYRNRTRLTPHAEAGVARYHSRFYETADWKGGGPGRHFVVDDTGGWFVSLGCNVALPKHLGLDGLYRYSKLDDVNAEACFSLACAHPRRGVFPMRNNLFGVGLFYAF
jgi:opacity protein-like surface antigen